MFNTNFPSSDADGKSAFMDGTVDIDLGTRFEDGEVKFNLRDGFMSLL